MRLSDAEWTVMTAVWAVAAEQDVVTARDVHARIGDSAEWAYTTVRTLLARLVEKGALTESKRGNQCTYVARISREDARSTAVRSLVERAFEGTLGSLLQHLVAKERLSKRDRAKLLELLDADAAKDIQEPPSRPGKRS
ncbi:MAG: BlaI/MecI/CopY family transcriptional regulator [Phycisphaerae bacterium]|nr:BlaI/MecI/CopY family transcriptional regulator [Phycisphaerae bacterium]